jgi:hypothetical protein
MKKKEDEMKLYSRSGKRRAIRVEGWVLVDKDGNIGMGNHGPFIVSGISFFYKQAAINGRKIPTPELDGQKWMQFPVPAEAS